MLVIRAWLEDDTDDFRARLIAMSDVDSGEEQVSYASSADQIHDALDRWLAGVVAGT